MYKWDMNEVSKEIRRYSKLRQREKDSEIREEIQNTIYSFLELQDYYDMCLDNTGGMRCNSSYSIVTGNVNFKEVIYDDLQILRNYGMYCPIVRDFVSRFDWQEIEKEKALSRFSVTKKELVEFTKQLYLSAGAFYSTRYQTLAQYFPTRLAIVDAATADDYTGYTHPIYGTDRVYIDVVKNNTIQDFCTIAHEVSHGITAIVNQDIMWDVHKYCFIETDSLFWELVGTDYAGEILHMQQEAEKLKRATFIDYLYNASLLCSKMDLYADLSSKQLNDKRFVRKYLKNVGYDKDAVNDTCTTFMHDYMSYIVSFLTAIELYLIYKVDEVRAINLLEKIVLMKGLSTKEYLASIRSLGIEPGKNISDYFEMIKPKGGFGYVKRI